MYKIIVKLSWIFLKILNYICVRYNYIWKQFKCNDVMIIEIYFCCLTIIIIPFYINNGKKKYICICNYISIILILKDIFIFPVIVERRIKKNIYFLLIPN